jgi:cytochrome c oxidase subunit 2
MHPLGYLRGSGSQTSSVLPLMWFMLIVSIVVCAIITGLVLWAVLTRRERIGPLGLRQVGLEQRDGVRWIWTGVAISAVPLIASLLWTVAVLAKTGSVPSRSPLVVDITAKRWWWDALYRGGTPAADFRTANEIHIPVGVPVLLHLNSPDVIHSFWVPKLAGKTDVIPGQINAMWIEAKEPGQYRGQCGEFCGAQHAHMGFLVIADPPQQFEAWRRGQAGPAASVNGPEETSGAEVFQQHCRRCHTVRGTPAHGSFGPDLTHLMTHATIGAGMFRNNPAALSGWVENAQTVKPGALMPNQHLSGPELAALRTYLGALR